MGAADVQASPSPKGEKAVKIEGGDTAAAATATTSGNETKADEAAAAAVPTDAEIAAETDPQKRAALIAARDKVAKQSAAQKQKTADDASADAAKSEKKPTHEKVGDAISTASTVLGAINSGGGAAVGAVAVKQPDGSYVLKDTLGPVSLTDPLTKSVLSKCVFGVSSLLKLTAAGVVLCTILEGCYKCYNAHASKPRWYGEFVLYLKRQESEILDTKEAGFKRLEFTNQLEMLLRRTLKKMEEIQARSTVSSLFFSGSDQEFLAATKIQVEKIKRAALQGMMTEIAEGGVLLKGELNAILATLEKQAAASAGPSDSLFLDEVRRVNQGILLAQLLNPCEFLKDVRDKGEAFCPGTRRIVLREFERWATLKELPPKPAKYDEHAERIFFLAGSPGSGKSTLAARIATTHATSMGAIHFCNHALSSRNDPLNIVKSILYQLCTRIPHFKSWFVTQLTREPKAGGGEPTLQKQLETNSIQNVHAFFKEFVVGGLCEVRAAAQQAKMAALAQGKSEQEAQQIAAIILPECMSVGEDGDVVVVDTATKDAAAGTAASSAGGDEKRVLTGSRVPQKLLILLDSLDESDQSTDDATSDDLVKILGDAALLAKLPHWVGLVVTSRMENRIMRAMRPYKHFKLDTSSPENRVDLELFLREKLRSIVRSEDLEVAIQIILSKSEGMFLYAQCVLGIAPDVVTEVGVQLSLHQIRNFPEGLTDFFRVTLKRVRECFVVPGEGEGAEEMPESMPNPRRQLSHRVLTASVGTPEEDAAARNFENVAALLRVVLAAREPLTIAQVACILGLSTAVVQAILLPMRSILPLRIDEQTAEGADASSEDARAQSVQRVASAAPPDSAQILLFHKSLHDYLTDPVRNNTAEESSYFVNLEEAHGLMHTMCLQQIFIKPELARSNANGKKQTQAQQVEELKKPFPLLRVAELLACKPGSLESYAVKYAVLHTLFVHDLTSLRFLLCSLQFVSLKIEFAQAGELLRQFNLALRRLEGRVTAQDLDMLTSPSGGHAASTNPHVLPGKKRVLKEELNLFRSMKRFLQAEMRHLTHGFAEEAQAQLIYQYANSYPVGHVAHAQANQPDLKPLWAGSQGLSVDYVLWLNQPLRLDAMIESWTELGPPLLSVAYHPSHDACQLASTGADGSLSIWSTTTGEVERCFKHAHQGACTAVAYMHDGGMVATGGEDGRIHSWALSQEGEQPLAVLPQPAGALDDAEDVLPSVAAQGGSDAHLVVKPGSITALCFSCDDNSGWIIAGSRDGKVYVWRKKTLSLKAVLESCEGAEAIAAGGVTGVAFSRNLSRPRRGSGDPEEPAVSKGFIASTAADGVLRVWEFDLITGVTLPARSFHKHAAALLCLCISPDNNHVAVGAQDKSILLFDLAHPTKVARHFDQAHGHGHQDAVRCVDFSSNGQQLASGSTDETVRMWSVASGACLNVHAGHHLPVNAVRFSPSNHRLVSVSSDESIRFWDAQLSVDHPTGSHSQRALANQCISADELKRTHCWNVTGVCFAGKDGSRIVTASEDKLLRVWRAKDATVESITEPLPFVPHHMIIGEVGSEGGGSKVPSQQLVFLASNSSSDVVVMALESGPQPAKICAQLTVGSAASASTSATVLGMDLSSDSKRLLVATSDNRVRVLSVGQSGSSLAEAPGAQLAEPLASTIRCVSFTDAAESSMVAVLDDDSAVIISGGAVVRKVARCTEGSSAGSVVVAAVSPFGDCTLIASVDAAGVVRVWDSSADAAASARRVVAAIQTDCSGVHVIHWVSAGSLFLATGLHQTFVWSFDGSGDGAGSVPFHFSGHDDTVTSLASCGSRFVSGSLDNRVCVWETKHVGAGEADAAAASAASSSPSSALPIASPSPDGVAVASASSSPIPLSPPPRRSFLFESERASATGTTHLYECHSGAHRLRIGAKQ